ncbi:adenylyltransferase/cytidyltransferase family protein [Candidatus Woesearchaeota archaeon]|jgi:cytidyltransferase-like protein|nr:adenylyltransferase/cytidyltransferase family protein [Candidatus Woesearchaeota archaeon]
MKIVYAYVCADIIHDGHLLALENAKALGDKLIVGVLTDEAVIEKKKRPTISFEKRLRIIKALKCVDCVVAQNDYSPVNNLKAIQPDIHMESTDHIGNPYMKQLKKAFKGRIVMMPYYPEVCSTEIKDKIKNGGE